MLKRFLSLLVFIPFAFLFFSSAAASANLPELSEKALVSVITCSASPDYEGGFGHSAIRIQDDSLHIDVVFNYGSYTNHQSFFLYKVFLGTVKSSLEGEHFHKFAERYKKEGRGLNEYILLFDRDQKQKLWRYLNEALISGNRFYKFNVPANNCTTQARDALFNVFGWDQDFYRRQSTGQTFRDIEKEDPLQNSWQHLVFQLVTGPGADKEVSLYQAAFSPNKFIVLLSQIQQNGKPVLSEGHRVFAPTRFKEAPATSVTLTFFIVLLSVSLLLFYLQYRNDKHFPLFDRILFLLTGAFGCFLLSLFFFSEITLLTSNYNILWALPTNLLLAFFIRKRKNKKWIIGLSRFTCFSLLLFPIAAFIGGQVIPAEAYLMALTLLLRTSLYAALPFLKISKK